MAVAKELDGKQAIKQVDRLFSNTGVDVWKLFGNWVPFVVGQRPEIVVALDWTDFDQDNQSTIALHLVTKHGRATPLLWKSVVKSELKDWRNEHEDALLERFREVVPPTTTKITLLADRGFGDHKLYELLRDQLGFDFVIRFRGVIKVTDTRISSPARRDRMLLIGAIAASLLTLLGAAGESLGLDMKMKANTVKTRTHSLLSQGLFYFDCLFNMRDERARPLMQRFDELLRQHAATRDIFGLI